MDADRSLALIAHDDQWLRCAHQDTVLLPAGGIGLNWDEVPRPSRWDTERGVCAPIPQPSEPDCPAGITHDRWCRTWRSRPLLGTVEAGRRRQAPPAQSTGGLRHPTGVAVDALDRLYVVESGGPAVMVSDLWSGHVLRRIPVLGRPLDVVAWGDAENAGALVLTTGPAAVVRVSGRTGPCAGPERLRRPCAHRTMRPARLTLLAGRVIVLWRDEETALVADLAGRELLEAPGATDIEGTAEGLLVVALAPGSPIRRYWERDGALIEDQPLAATGYDGGAVTVDPSGRVVYTTASGQRSTQGPQARHVRTGTVTSYRLDSDSYRTRWGRVFLYACLPTGTSLEVRAVTADEDDVADPPPASPPARGYRPVRDPDRTPPLPSAADLEAVDWLPVVRVRQGGMLGALDPVGAEWARYETGVDAPPGRYLWLQLRLTGTERTAPRVRSVAVERPGHALLNALPRMYSSDDVQADFLHGFLTPAEGMLHDLDAAAAERRVLLDPATVPAEAMAWLASLAGIVLDLRWPEEARRALLAEVYPLYARRGTAAALERLLRLYLGRDARIVEQWRLRGLGGGFLGFDPRGLDSPTVAGTTRRAGMLGHFTIGGRLPDTDSYRRFAHRFTVLVPGCLTAEQREVVGDIVRTHKPSHTLGEICELGDGLPVGRLRIGLTAFVAPRRGRRMPTLGSVRLGPGSTLGAPTEGSRVGSVRVGKVRVG